VNPVVSLYISISILNLFIDRSSQEHLHVCLSIKTKDWNRSIVDDTMNKDLPSVQSGDKGCSNSGFRRSECLKRKGPLGVFVSGVVTQFEGREE
jgi:hypothetical protein